MNLHPLHRRMIYRLFWCLLGIAAMAAIALAQDQTTIVITGQSKLVMAVPDFPASGAGPNVAATFNQVLWNDLYQSAVVKMVGRSLYTAPTPTGDGDMNSQAARTAWSGPPLGVQRLVFGTMQGNGTGLVVNAYLYDVTQPVGGGRLLGRRYADPNTAEGARQIAHQLANDIVAALGFGPGIATSQIAFISNRSGSQEVWTMDYDGHNQQQRTHLKSIAYSPKISPDGTKLAFMSEASGRPQIKILNLETNRLLPFPTFQGDLNESPAWSPDGQKLAFASKMDGPNLEIYTVNLNGSGLKRLTYSHNYDNFSPAWDPKPPAGSAGQLAFVSSRQGLPQVYTMNADGSHQVRVSQGGYAADPSWSPNGLMLAYAWARSGGENDGMFDIYWWNFATQTYVQLTHNELENDYPSWAPDNRHLVFQSGPPYHTQLFTVAVDGSVPAQLTSSGNNEMPNWSWH